MINLMYIVLMAMLALNISTEVLHGFSIVEEGLNRTTGNASEENEAIYGNFKDQMASNPEKVRQWFEKATQVKQMSDSLYDFAQELKVAIVRKADGKDGDVRNIDHVDDLDAATEVMLSPISGKGHKLFNAINSYRDRILTMITDPGQRQTRITIFKNIIIMCFILNRKWGHLPWQTIRIEELVDNIGRNRNRIFQCA